MRGETLGLSVQATTRDSLRSALREKVERDEIAVF
jgi:hypothetical protein